MTFRLFAWKSYYPGGGMNDLQGTFDTVDAARAVVMENDAGAHRHDEWLIQSIGPDFDRDAKGEDDRTRPPFVDRWDYAQIVDERFSIVIEGETDDYGRGPRFFWKEEE